MRFHSLTTPAPREEDLLTEYRDARAIGVIRLGRTHLFFRAGRKRWYLPYTDITRCYRRVLMIPARMCCGTDAFPVEHLVLERDGTELAQIQLPGTRAALGILDALGHLAPAVQIGKPNGREAQG